MTTLLQATKEWSSRPDDQRYNSLESLHEACVQSRSEARECERPYADLRVQDMDGMPVLIGPSGTPAKFTHWSFGQAAARAGAPAGYLRQLPAALVADCLNHGFSKNEGDVNLYMGVNGSLTIRSLNSDKYTRIFNSDITSRLLRLAENGPWQPAPAAFDGSRGLYASDHDMFAFLVDNNRRIFETGPGGGLGRGFFVGNSEVGAATFSVTTFLYEYVCGNHRVWGAKGVRELRIRHVGTADARAFSQLAVELRRYSEESADGDEAKVQRARITTLGSTKDEVIDRVFGLRIPALTMAKVSQAYELADQHADWYGDPKSVWGFTGGLTEVARDMPFADDRVALERASGKLMDIAF